MIINFVITRYCEIVVIFFENMAPFQIFMFKNCILLICLVYIFFAVYFLLAYLYAQPVAKPRGVGGFKPPLSSNVALEICTEPMKNISGTRGYPPPKKNACRTDSSCNVFQQADYGFIRYCNRYWIAAVALARLGIWFGGVHAGVGILWSGAPMQR